MHIGQKTVLSQMSQTFALVKSGGKVLLRLEELKIKLTSTNSLIALKDDDEEINVSLC